MLFPNNFLDFRWDTIKKLGIINLSIYSSKGYVPRYLVFRGCLSWVRGGYSRLSISLLCFIYSLCCISKEVLLSDFLVFHTLSFSSRSAVFLFLILFFFHYCGKFFHHKLSLFDFNLTINSFCMFIQDFRTLFEPIFEISHTCSFFFLG